MTPESGKENRKLHDLQPGSVQKAVHNNTHRYTLLKPQTCVVGSFQRRTVHMNCKDAKKIKNHLLLKLLFSWQSRYK